VVLPDGLAHSNCPVWSGARHGGRREASGAAVVRNNSCCLGYQCWFVCLFDTDLHFFLNLLEPRVTSYIQVSRDLWSGSVFNTKVAQKSVHINTRGDSSTDRPAGAGHDYQELPHRPERSGRPEPGRDTVRWWGPAERSYIGHGTVSLYGRARTVTT
jgi:hypothetical protein